jgi:hypothetical protein
MMTARSKGGTGAKTGLIDLLYSFLVFPEIMLFVSSNTVNAEEDGEPNNDLSRLLIAFSIPPSCLPFFLFCQYIYHLDHACMHSHFIIRFCMSV